MNQNGNDPVTAILARLDKVKKTGPQQWMATCPVPSHDDKTPSLAIGVGDDGRVLLNCLAGCNLSEVLDAMGMSDIDLFIPKTGSNGRQPAAPRRVAPKPQSRGYATVELAAKATMRKHKLTRVYAYSPDFAVARFEPKSFRPYRKDETGWVCGDAPSPLPLFGLKSIKDGKTVLVVEGEEDCETAHMLGFAAVTNAHGADAARKADWSSLAGKDVALIPDNDAGGRKHADVVLGELRKLDPLPTVRRLELPGIVEKGDLSDWVEARDSRDTNDLSAMLVELIHKAPIVLDAASNVEPSPPPAGGVDGGGETDSPSAGRVSMATLLIGLCQGVELFHYEEDGFARVRLSGHVENWGIRSRGFKSWLARQFYIEHRKSPNGQAITDAIATIEGQARWEGAEFETHIRVGAYEEKVYLDLCDPTWRAVEIDGNGWRIVESGNIPVRFIRRKGMKALPEPRRGGSVDDLRRFVNLKDHGDWTLFVAWLVAAFRSRGPYPVLVVNGEQGSAKSTICKLAREIIDPSKASLRRPPKDERDLMIGAANGHVVAFDNLSGLPAILSDALCALATGAGFGTRQLYSDDEERLFEGARPIMLNGIEDIATRPDLLDRAVSIMLPTIAPSERRDEAGLMAEFESARPGILGALLDAVSAAIANLPSVQLAKLPRMADFAKWVTAAEPGLGWDAGRFMAAYEASRDDANACAIESSAIGPPIIALMESRTEWEGTAGELLKAIEGNVDERTLKGRDWPRSARGMAGKLRRVVPNLRAQGVLVEDLGRTKSRRLMKIRRTPSSTSSPSSTPPTVPSGAFWDN